jgi:hypothetical protein
VPWYLISFDDGSMDRIPHEDWPEVGERSHAVVQEAEDAGVWISGGGVEADAVTLRGLLRLGVPGTGRQCWPR